MAATKVTQHAAMDATKVAEAFAKDPMMRRAGQQLGLTSANDLLPRPRSAFEVESSEREEVVDLRIELFERKRQTVAADVLALHEKLRANELRRAASASTIRPSLSTASSSTNPVFVTPAQQRAKAKADGRRLQLLKKAREHQSDSFYESKHLEAQKALEKARHRHDDFLAQQREARRQLAEKQMHGWQRARVARAEEDALREKARLGLVDRMRRATQNAEKVQQAQDRVAQKLRARESRRDLQRSKTLDKLDRREMRRVQTLTDKLNRQEEQVRQRVWRKQQDEELAEERRRILRENAEHRLSRHGHARSMVEAEIRQKHLDADERLAQVHAAKRADMEARRLASYRSSQERRAVIINSQGQNAVTNYERDAAWMHSLRFVPLDEDK